MWKGTSGVIGAGAGHGRTSRPEVPIERFVPPHTQAAPLSKQWLERAEGEVLVRHQGGRGVLSERRS